MPLLGSLLKNRRAGEAHLAWNLPVLAAPDTSSGADALDLRSPSFTDGGTMPLESAGRRVGGRDLSPELSWTAVPPQTAQLLLVVEDVDVPVSKPFVHCVALIDPEQARTMPAEGGAFAGPVGQGLAAGALSGEGTRAGVLALRAQMGRGYRGPAPIKGHGPHRYVFQLFALGVPLPAKVAGVPLQRAKPRAVLAAAGPVLARGRMTGVYER
jgi:phosphatidylethanolamine-binding protein (PEBP) family uncharacterized protein